MINTQISYLALRECPKLIHLIPYQDHLNRPSLNIIEGAFILQGYEPIRENDFDEFYQLFPDQESFIRQARHAILSGHLPLLRKDNGVEVIDTYAFIKWTIENIAEDRWAHFLDHEWQLKEAKKVCSERKTKNNHSFRPKSEIENKYLVLDAARSIRQQDDKIPVYLMIEHIQNEYEHIEQIADTLKKWIIGAGISAGLTKNLPQAEKLIYRKKKFIF